VCPLFFFEATVSDGTIVGSTTNREARLKKSLAATSRKGVFVSTIIGRTVLDRRGRIA
jgi:hypothetical protein